MVVRWLLTSVVLGEGGIIGWVDDWYRFVDEGWGLPT